METAVKYDECAPTTAPDATPLPLRFIAEGELALLVKLLRCLGLDCLYDGGTSLPTAISRATAEGRILLTLKPVADTRQLKVVRVPSSSPEAQLAAVSGSIPLWDNSAPFTRCLVCNELLTWEPNPPPGSVPERVRKRPTIFHRCPGCGRIYWAGTHVDRLRRRLAQAGMLPPTVHRPLTIDH